MIKNLTTNHTQEHCVLIGALFKQQNEELLIEHLDELAFLAETAGAITKKRFTQRLDHPDAKTFLGSGKLKEISDYIKANDIDLVVFDDELSGSQIRNIEKSLNEGRDLHNEIPYR